MVNQDTNLMTHRYIYKVLFVTFQMKLNQENSFEYKNAK